MCMGYRALQITDYHLPVKREKIPAIHKQRSPPYLFLYDDDDDSCFFIDIHACTYLYI